MVIEFYLSICADRSPHPILLAKYSVLLLQVRPFRDVPSLWEASSAWVGCPDVRCELLTTSRRDTRRSEHAHPPPRPRGRYYWRSTGCFAMLRTRNHAQRPTPGHASHHRTPMDQQPLGERLRGRCPVARWPARQPSRPAPPAADADWACDVREPQSARSSRQRRRRSLRGRPTGSSTCRRGRTSCPCTSTPAASCTTGRLASARRQAARRGPR